MIWMFRIVFIICVGAVAAVGYNLMLSENSRYRIDAVDWTLDMIKGVFGG